MNRTFLFSLGIAAICLSHGAFADSMDNYKLIKNRERKAENARIIAGEDIDKVRRESDVKVNEAWEAFLRQDETSGFGLVGLPALNGEFPVAHLDEGATGVLNFQFFDTHTRAPTGAAGLIAAGVNRVDYYANLDPNLEDAEGLAIYNVFVGSSSDVDSLFALPYLIAGFEDDIEATPYDAAGNLIVFPGVDGNNVARGTVVNISVPETSSTACLLALSAFGLLTLFRLKVAGHEGCSRPNRPFTTSFAAADLVVRRKSQTRGQTRGQNTGSD